jgi:hypothetical protein
MKLFNRSNRTQTVNDFILHRGRSAIKVQQNILLGQKIENYSFAAARRAIDERVAQVNLDLSASNLRNLSVQFADEEGLPLSRKVSGKELSSRVNMFVVSNESLKRARFI